MVKNGSAYIESVVFDTPALIGGEYSGHIFFRDDYYGYDDGFYAGLRFAQILDKLGVKASDLIKEMKTLKNTPEIRVEVGDDRKYEIIDKIKEYVKEKGYKCSFIDGVRVEYPDGFALVRCSNTGPYITMRFEAATDEELLDRKNEFLIFI
jgi:phosphomannomutase/phosphoglucomutase